MWNEMGRSKIQTSQSGKRIEEWTGSKWANKHEPGIYIAGG